MRLMRPWRRRGVLAAALGLLATGLSAAPAAAENPVSTAVTAAAPLPAAVAIQPAIKDLLASRSGPVDTTQCEALFSVACYEPAQIQTAYDEGPLLGRGVTGRGQTIAVIDAFGSPSIAADLATFDQTFGLPAPPSLRVIQPAGAVPPFSSTDSSMIAWASETTVDVEWAHVMAPGASILLVETPVAETEGTTGFAQIVQAENFVINHHLADIISQSFSATEQTLPQGLRSVIPLRSSFVNAFFRDVTVLASSGDDGSTEPLNSAGTELSNTPVTTWPASDPLVTGVGGTQLHLSGTTGSRTAPDSVWNDGNNAKLDQEFFGNSGPDAAASGGGLSVDFPRPGYQSEVRNVVGRARGVPDVSMSAACNGAVDVYESFPGVGPGWYLSCGTSESTPLFAGIVALANQVAHRPLGLINPAMYKLSAERAPGISDVTTGNNTVSFSNGKAVVSVPGHAAKPGYDLASGVGTVDAARFVPELAKAATNRPPHHEPSPCSADADHGDHRDSATAYDDDRDCCPATNGHGDSEHCCPVNNGNDRGQQCCPDSDWNPTEADIVNADAGNSDGHDHCTDSGGSSGSPAPGGPGEGSGPGKTPHPGQGGPPCPGGSTTPAHGSLSGASTGQGTDTSRQVTTAASPTTTGLSATTTGLSATTTTPSATAPGGASTTTAASQTTPTPGQSPASSATTQPASNTPAHPTTGTAQPSTSTSTSLIEGPESTSAQANVSLVVPGGVILASPATVNQLLRE
jgi:hypothetical protein